MAGLTTNTYTVDTSLAEGACHFWRVDGSNGCGEGEWSQVFGFETERFQQAFLGRHGIGRRQVVSRGWPGDGWLDTDYLRLAQP